MDIEDLKVQLGNYIRTERRAQNLSQEKLAELADLHPTYISRIESGKSLPAVDVLMRISSSLGGTVADLLSVVESSRSTDPIYLAETDRRSDSNQQIHTQIRTLLQDCSLAQLKLIKGVIEVVKRTST